MPKRDLNLVIAANLRYFMALDRCLYKNANALGKKAGVSPSYVRYLLDPKKRTVAAGKAEGDGYPKIDKLQRLAPLLACEVWELLHPDIEKSLREREMYASIEKNMKEKGVIPAPAKVTAKV